MTAFRQEWANIEKSLPDSSRSPMTTMDYQRPDAVVLIFEFLMTAAPLQ
jgi:hypothetical protein